MSFGPDPRDNPGGQGGRSLKSSAKGFEPEGYTMYSYAAMQIIKDAAEKAVKSLERQEDC